MRHETIIHEDLTKARFNYNSFDLSKGSHKPVITECVNCHKIIEKEYRYLDRKHQCSVIDGNLKRCFKCSTWKDVSFFNKSPKLSGGVAKMCRKCYNSHDAVKKCEINRKHRIRHSFETDIKEYIRYRTYQLKNNCTRKSITCDIDTEYLIALWESQKGKCYYSNLDMKAEGKVNGFQGWFSPSLDRKNPSLGYTKGNVAWCCFAVNSFKQSMTEEQFKELLKTIQWNK